MKRRATKALLYCRLMGYSRGSWVMVDSAIADDAEYTRSSFQDVRLGRRDMSSEAVERLNACLGERAQFAGLVIFTKAGREKVFKD